MVNSESDQEKTHLFPLEATQNKFQQWPYTLAFVVFLYFIRRILIHNDGTTDFIGVVWQVSLVMPAFLSALCIALVW